jgi:hypothetical protein
MLTNIKSAKSAQTCGSPANLLIIRKLALPASNRKLIF